MSAPAAVSVGDSGAERRGLASLAVPQIAMPTGGGAIRGVGETFAANPATGSATCTLPIPLPPGRSGFGPTLGLTYDSGNGNGPFGLGWTLGLPSISRRTDRGVPRYDDDADTFLLPGQDALVPVLGPDGTVDDDTTAVAGYTIRSYRPRVDAASTRIERWTRDDGDVHWRTITTDNVQTVFGADDDSRVADPADRRRVFAWLICDTRDDRGNAVVFEHRAEDGAGIGADERHEVGRGPAGDPSRLASRYLTRIRFGNVASLLDPVTAERPLLLDPGRVAATRWMFDVEFDYSSPDDDLDAAEPDVVRAWGVRGDPFSTYRPGFELRTYRLCRRVLVFHDFPDDPDVGPHCLVRATELRYDATPLPAAAGPSATVAGGIARLRSGTQRSYQRVGGAWRSAPFPPVEFDYSVARLDVRVRDVDGTSLANLPTGSAPDWRWIDFDGDGLSGLLVERAGEWHYKPNVADGRPRLGPLRRVGSRPAMAAMAGGTQALVDVDRDGAPDLVDLRGPLGGFHGRADDGGWTPFAEFSGRPDIDWGDPNLRFVDLTGDGAADVLVTSAEAWTWYPSLGRDGFGAGRTITAPGDERDGPRLVFADGEHSIHLADMSGDGLVDLVRIRNGRISYWPNLGHGRFGRRLDIDDAPTLDLPGRFDPRRVRLADVDGSGTTDLVYLGSAAVSLWFNVAGNRWVAGPTIPLPEVAEGDDVQVVDLLGNGTGCLVWSSALPGAQHAPMRYVDLMGGVKPHLLTEMRNNLGAVVSIGYVASTRFLLDDRAAGRPWRTRLPFPVQCVSTVTHRDRHRGTTFTASYSYHHGDYDGVEREFRGFGRVEQVDTQRFDDVAAANTDSPYVTSDHRLYQAPVLTTTWFHTGRATSRPEAEETFTARHADRFEPPADGSPVEVGIAAVVIEGTSSAAAWRQAARAAKGTVLRTEVTELDVRAFHEDGVMQPVRLLSVEQRGVTVREVQPMAGGRDAVFQTLERETVTSHHDLVVGAARLRVDPRVEHSLVLSWDRHGRPLRQATIAYPRRGADPMDPGDPAPLGAADLAAIAAAQHDLAIVLTEGDVGPDLPPAPGWHRLAPMWASRRFELRGVVPPAGGVFTSTSLGAYAFGAGDPGLPLVDVDHHQGAPAGTASRRLLEHTVTRLLADDLTAPLEPGVGSRRGIVAETYQLAMTAAMLGDVLGAAAVAGGDDLVAEAVAALGAPGPRQGFAAAGYAGAGEVGVELASGDAAWWVRSGVGAYSADARGRFFLPNAVVDAFGNATTIVYDGDDYAVRSVVDPAGNATTVDEFDHRVLAPRRVRDTNDNVVEVAYDVHGMPAATARLGKVAADGAASTGNGVGQATFEDLNPSADAVRAFLDAPIVDAASSDAWLADAAGWLATASTRTLSDFGERVVDGEVRWAVVAPAACAMAREVDHVEQRDGEPVALHVTVSYSDGGGRTIVTKQLAEAEQETAAPPRWIASGRRVMNNKGKPVLRYEPHFSDTAQRFEEPVAAGVTAVAFYDAVGRLVRTEHPDGSVSRMVLSPWSTRSFDRNDTVLEAGNRWYRERTGPTALADDRRCARLAAIHAGTPAVAHFDVLGRPAVFVVHQRRPVDRVGGGAVVDGDWADERIVTVTRRDVDGRTLWTRDGRGNVVVQHVVPPLPAGADELGAGQFVAYDLAGRVLVQRSMDGGRRMALADGGGQPFLRWDVADVIDPATGGRTREHLRVEHRHDTARRPTERLLRRHTDGDATVSTALVERFRYGEQRPGAAGANLRGAVWQHLDGSGITQIDANDLGGGPLVARRRLAVARTVGDTGDADWAGVEVDDVAGEPPAGAAELLAAEAYTQRVAYDALGRPVRRLAWHVEDGAASASRVAVHVPAYNRRGLLAGYDLTVRAALVPGAVAVDTDTTVRHAVVRRADYDAHGRRVRLDLGNGTSTVATYAPDTFRLVHLYTRRDPAFAGDCAGDPQVAQPARPCGVQNIHLTYDPVGNVTRVRDDAQQRVFFANAVAEPSADFAYDALYRLVEATGRENAAAVGPPADVEGPWPAGTLPSADTTRPYTQRYDYDAAGNLVATRHVAPGLGGSGGWTRRHEIAADSNRLARSWFGGDHADDPGVTGLVDHRYDAHGNLLNLAGAGATFDLRWNADDLVRTIELGGGGRVAHRYAADRARSCKRIDRHEPTPASLIGEERIYLGGVERFRRFTGDPSHPFEEIESHHVVDGDRRLLLVDDVVVADGIALDGTPGRASKTCWRYQYGNHLGSANVELDDVARVISYEEYHPYGTTAYRLASSAVEAPPKRYRFTGMERDEETGLACHGARSYHPGLARWISVDPIGTADGFNVYAYCRGSPINATDRSGRAQLPQGTTPTGLLEEAQATLRLERLTHLDRGSSQALLMESQGSGVVDATNNTFIHHVDDIERDIASGRRLASQIDTITGDKSVVMRKGVRDALVDARRQLVSRLERVEEAVRTAKTLNREFAARLRGIQLPAGRVAEDSLAVAPANTQKLPMLPNDSRFAGQAESIAQLPVRPGQSAAPPASLARPAPAAPAEPPAPRLASVPAAEPVPSAGRAPAPRPSLPMSAVDSVARVGGGIVLSGILESGHGQRPYGWEDDELAFYVSRFVARLRDRPDPPMPNWMQREENARLAAEQLERDERAAAQAAESQWRELRDRGPTAYGASGSL